MKFIERFLFVFYLILLESTVIYMQRDGPNPDICTVETESCGPLPPSVPESFIMKSESVDLENQVIFWEERYFDSVNVRAKYKEVHQGKEYHYIFDYDKEQILSYVVVHPGVSAENDPGSLESCYSTDMESNPVHRIFGYRYRNLDSKRTKMYNSFEALQFGGNYKYAFNETKKIPDRGIPSRIYHSCLYDSSGLTLDKTFYWSNETLTATGDETVPIKIDTYGEIFTYPKGDGKAVKEDLWYIENIPWFQGNPTFDEAIFQIPRGMYCKDDRETKEVPNLPKYFSGRLEITDIKRNMEGEMQDLGIEHHTDIWYDSDNNMARVDFMASFEDEDVFLYMGQAPLSGVYDVSEGVVYYTNKFTGECRPFAIPRSFFLLSKNSERKLAPPNEVLGFDVNNLEYKGKNFARNVHCNVWASQGLTEDKMEYFVEVYFATDGWHSDSEEDEEYDYPLRITMIEYFEEDNKTYEITSETNIFKYKATQPPPSVYDISGCRNSKNQKYFFFSIQKSGKDISLAHHKIFLQAIRNAIKDFSKIGSLLRVQDVDIYVPSTTRNVIVSFTLMDTPLVMVNGTMVKQPGTSLLMAEANLRRAIDNGDFGIPITLDPNHGEEIIHSLPGSLIQAIPQAEAFTEGTKYAYPLDEEKNTVAASDIQYSEKKENDGYSPGSLGGLAIGMLIAGILLGIGCMYYYLMKYGQQGNSPAILMQDR